MKRKKSNGRNSGLSGSPLFWTAVFLLVARDLGLGVLLQHAFTLVGLVLLLALLVLLTGALSLFTSLSEARPKPTSPLRNAEAAKLEAGEGGEGQPEDPSAFHKAVEALIRLKFTKAEAVALAKAAWAQGARKTEELLSQALKLHGRCERA